MSTLDFDEDLNGPRDPSNKIAMEKTHELVLATQDHALPWMCECVGQWGRYGAAGLTLNNP